ncbi:dephospho-CoA kinase [Peribacillus cavernae]|uniref:Dephospho-CoA kinase n=1 Tax=Peribacillus cavernae TaxID=1674310 RepID=A0A3S0VIR8_9BACI|nr:dephospho-CoA kinase [Peribacillus cavernae]MDQ0220093.1 dephospho-CoA kinase [Peribacillus cavernae]RUQ25458.1 dephospho-CoA kinase [Peribacillus cavernae]
MRQVIGITGGIASGKSSVSQFIRDDLGFTIIDADLASREVVEPGEKAYNKIVESFGPQILLDEETIDRAKLGAIIFNDTEKRLLLNSIVHPAVRKRMIALKDAAFEREEETVFMDIPLLFESKLTTMVDKTLVVYVDKRVQIERLMKRNDYSEAEALARIASQMPLSEKKALADAVIDNNGDFEDTILQVRQVLLDWNVNNAE